MHFVFVGAGGVGGYYGALLARQGHTVGFVARGAHLQAMRSQGLQIFSPHGDFSLPQVMVSESAQPFGQADVLFSCVKAYDMESALQAMTPAVGPNTLLISLQNGVEAAEALSARFGVGRVAGGVTWVSSFVEAPGVIRQVSQFRRIVLGELDGSHSPRLEALRSVLAETGLQVEISAQIEKILWTKLVFISAASSFGALTGLPIGQYRAVPPTRALIRQLMAEVQSVARALGIALDEDVVEQALGFLDSAAPAMRASFQVDVAAGKRFELEALLGVIGRKARLAGVPTPLADSLYALLLPVYQANLSR